MANSSRRPKKESAAGGLWHERLSSPASNLAVATNGTAKNYVKSTANSRIKAKVARAPKETDEVDHKGKPTGGDDDSAFQNPAIQYFINDLRGALSEEPRDPKKVDKILENIQYLVSKEVGGRERVPASESEDKEERKARKKLEKEKEDVQRRLAEAEKLLAQTNSALQQKGRRFQTCNVERLTFSYSIYVFCNCHCDSFPCKLEIDTLQARSGTLYFLFIFVSLCYRTATSRSCSPSC